MSRWGEDKRRTGTAAEQLRRSLAAANCLQLQTKQLHPDVGINLEILIVLSKKELTELL